MPLIDLHCHFGPTPGAMSVRPPELADALAYADLVGASALCFAASDGSVDVRGANARLSKTLRSDPRLRGWLTLSVHGAQASADACRTHLLRERWIGARFECPHEGDALSVGGGPELLNALRRYGKPILVTVGNTRAIDDVLRFAREIPGLRFLMSPQSEELVADAIPAMREVLNTSLVPVAAYVERDMIAYACSQLGERGERRVLWASDWGRFHPAAALGMLGDTAISNSQRERIAYRNALELIPA